MREEKIRIHKTCMRLIGLFQGDSDFDKTTKLFHKEEKESSPPVNMTRSEYENAVLTKDIIAYAFGVKSPPDPADYFFRPQSWWARYAIAAKRRNIICEEFTHEEALEVSKWDLDKFLKL